MKLSLEDVKHIAELARLELTDEELNIYEKQLSNVLDYIDQLQEVDTTDVEPTAQVTGLENVMRDDIVLEWNKEEVASSLGQAAKTENKQIKVKRILNAN